MSNYYDELLKLCGFDDKEINREKPRIEKAFQKLELRPEDIKIAESWVRQNHDIELKGVRKMLRLWMLEMIDLILAKEDGKRLVYYGFPTISGPAMVIATASADIFVTCPDVVLCYSLGQIFNKINPIIEAGEANGLPSGFALCSLQQTRTGGMAKGIIPVPDLVLTSSYYCDMGTKNDELLHEVYGHPAIYIDGSMDSKWGIFPEYVPERVDYLGGQIEKAFSRAQDILGIEITEEVRRQAASRNSALMEALVELCEVTRDADPQPLSAVEIDLAAHLVGSGSSRILEEGPDVVNLIRHEVEERVAKGIGVVEKGAPRIMIFLAPFADPSIIHMIENHGLNISLTIPSATSKHKTGIPLITGKNLAEREMVRGTYYGTFGRITRVAEMARDAKVDGIIWNYLYNCRPEAIYSHLLKQVVEKETGIPVLSLENDLVDSRTYSSASLSTRVGAFAEMLKAIKVSANS